jgi:hypothetical protein
MLTELKLLNQSELATIKSRLFGALERMHKAAKYRRTNQVWMLAFLIAYVATPAVLLRWSEARHTIIGYVLLFVITAFLGFLILLILLVVITPSGGSINLSTRSAGESPVKLKAFEVTRLFGPKRDMLWAWSESKETERLRKQARNRRKAIYRTMAITTLIVMISAGALIGLHASRSTLIEIVCISFLTPVCAAALALVIDTSGRISRPASARLADSLDPGDATLIDLVNLAFLTNRSRSSWQDPYDTTRLLAEFERAARTAEYAFPGRNGRALARDTQTKNWARDKSARLAAGFRLQKRTILLAQGPDASDAIIQSLCSGLVSACNGNWEELTKSDAPPSGPTRLKRLARLLTPPALLAAAAIYIPELAKTTEIRSAIRVSLIIAAILALITAVSPESEKAADTVQTIVGKLPGQ